MPHPLCNSGFLKKDALYYIPNRIVTNRKERKSKQNMPVLKSPQNLQK